MATNNNVLFRRGDQTFIDENVPLADGQIIFNKTDQAIYVDSESDGTVTRARYAGGNLSRSDIDMTLSTTSENPVANKVITNAIGNLPSLQTDVKTNLVGAINEVNTHADTAQSAITAEATARQTADNTLQGNINSEASARASADSNLQSQINQIVAPSGEAPSAAEVQNARIGADGTVYDTLGNAIRDQVTDLKSDSFNTRFNKEAELLMSKWTSGKYVYYADGHIGNSSTYSCSELIALNANAEYEISGVSTFQYAIYDANGTYIRGSNEATSFIPTDNEFYFRFSCPTADLSNLSITYSFKSLIMSEASELFKQPTITWTDGKYRRYHDGGISTNANWSYSSFIPVIPNEVITCGYDINHISFFDENFNYVTGWTNKNAMKVPNGALYMCVSLPTANKGVVSITHNAKHITLTEENYSYYKNAFDEAQALLLPIHVIGGEYDVSDIYQIIGLQLYNDLIGIGNPRFYASPSAYNDEFSIINLKATTINKNITVDGITFDATNMRYCVHDEMGGTTTLEGIHGYTHTYKNCTFISRENVYRPVGIGVGDDGLITFENCIFESTAENAPVNLLDIHSGFQGQNKHTNSFVKDCIFINGTCSFTEFSSYDYSSDKNICVAENNYCSAEPYVTRTNNKQIQFYSWNNHIVQ